MKKILFSLIALLCTLPGFALEKTITFKTDCPEFTGVQIQPCNSLTAYDGLFTITTTKGSTASENRLRSNGQLQIYLGGTLTVAAKEGYSIVSAVITSNLSTEKRDMTVTDGVASFTVTEENQVQNNSVSAVSIEINYEENAQAVEFTTTCKVSESPEYINAPWNGGSSIMPFWGPLTFADGDLSVSVSKGGNDPKLRTSNGGMLQVYPGSSYVITPAAGVTLVSAKLHVANPVAEDRDMTIVDNEARYAVVGSYIGVSYFEVTYTKGGPQQQQCAAPTFSLPAGEVPFHTAVTLACETPGATIHYTLNNKEELIAPADGVIYITGSATVEAWATLEGWVASKKVKCTYTVQSPQIMTYNLAAPDGEVERVDITRGVWVEFVPAATCENNQFTVPADGKVYLCGAEGILFSEATAGTKAMTMNASYRIGTLTVDEPYTFSSISVKQYGKAVSAAKSQEFTAYQIAEGNSAVTSATGTATLKLTDDNYTTTIDGFTFSIAKADAVTTPAYNKAGDLRIYAGSTFTVTAPDLLEKIEFYISAKGKEQMGSLICSNGLIPQNMWIDPVTETVSQPANGVYTWECQPTQPSNTVTFTVPAKGNLGTAKAADGSPKAGQLDFDKIVVYYNELVTKIGNVMVDNDANAPVEYYNLQGVRVMNPEHGIYIRVQGRKATKVAF